MRLILSLDIDNKQEFINSFNDKGNIIHILIKNIERYWLIQIKKNTKENPFKNCILIHYNVVLNLIINSSIFLKLCASLGAIYLICLNLSSLNNIFFPLL